jgi:hypothetical protein
MERKMFHSQLSEFSEMSDSFCQKLLRLL